MFELEGAIYIYIYRERESEMKITHNLYTIYRTASYVVAGKPTLSNHLHFLFVCIHIYIYIYIYIYIVYDRLQTL